MDCNVGFFNYINNIFYRDMYTDDVLKAIFAKKEDEPFEVTKTDTLSLLMNPNVIESNSFRIDSFFYHFNSAGYESNEFFWEFVYDRLIHECIPRTLRIMPIINTDRVTKKINIFEKTQKSIEQIVDKIFEKCGEFFQKRSWQSKVVIVIFIAVSSFKLVNLSEKYLVNVAVNSISNYLATLIPHLSPPLVSIINSLKIAQYSCKKYRWSILSANTFHLVINKQLKAIGMKSIVDKIYSLTSLALFIGFFNFTYVCDFALMWLLIRIGRASDVVRRKSEIIHQLVDANYSLMESKKIANNIELGRTLWVKQMLKRYPASA